MTDRREFLRHAAGSALAAGLWPGAVRPAAPKPDASEAFFAGPVPRFTITLDEANLKSLKQNPRGYVRAQVRDEQKTYRDVGIHIKGAAGSSRPFDDKPALTLNFDKYVPGQTYHAIDKLHLNNSVQDPTCLMEMVCGDLFLRAGVPTPRGTHALVELQGKKRGLYVLKEGFDRTFLRRHFKNVSGNLYDGGFLTDIDRPIRKSSGSGPGPERGDLQALAAACREPDLSKRAERLETLLDVDRFLSLVALEVLTWHWDGYAMKANNYRVYHDPDSGKITILPHGMDQMFWMINGPIDPPEGGLIARRMFQMPEYRERYFARLRTLRADLFVPDAIDRRIDGWMARLTPVLQSADRRLAERQQAMADHLKEMVRKRAEGVDKLLARRAEKK